MKTIIVDDSDLIRERLVDILSDIRGVQIVGQESEAHRALVSIRSERPDLVILDFRLIGGSGVDFLHKIKYDNPDIKVIIFTSSPFPQYRRRSMEEGVDVFLNKSTGFKHIKPTVQRLIKEAEQKVGQDEA